MIVYSRINCSDSTAIGTHLLENYYKFEPSGLALGLTITEVATLFPKLIDEILCYGKPVSIMAVDTTTNEIVGVAINIILDPSNSKTTPSLKSHLNRDKHPVNWQIAMFLENLEEGVDLFQELNLDASKTYNLFKCLFLSVSPKYSCRGIAKTLIRESEVEAMQLKGDTVATTDVTSHFSFLAFRKLGYGILKEVKYLQYKNPEGILIFEGKKSLLGLHKSAKVMAKILGGCRIAETPCLIDRCSVS